MSEEADLGCLLDQAAVRYHTETADVLESLRNRLGRGALSVDEWNALVGAAGDQRLDAWRRNGRKAVEKL